MVRFFVLRFARLLITLWVLVTVVFFALHLTPVSPVAAMLGPAASPEFAKALKHRMGLDQPLWMQYATYMMSILRGDWGISWRSGVRVSKELLSALSYTVVLTAAAMVVATLWGIGTGILSALRRGSTLDVATRLVAQLGISTPIFVINLAGLYLFAYKYPWFPTLGSRGWESLVLPAITLGFYDAATMVRLVRASTLEVLAQDYVQAARSRGIAGFRLLARHILPNTLVTVITFIGIQVGILMGGAVITESVFAWPGLGRLTVTAILAKDIPVVQGTVTCFAASYMIANFLVDLAYPLLDPRILRPH